MHGTVAVLNMKLMLRKKTLGTSFLLIFLASCSLQVDLLPTVLNETEAVNNAIVSLLQSPSCRFPCFWNIQPGVDTRVTSLEKLSEFRPPLYFDETNPDMLYGHLELNRDNVTLLVTVDFFQADGQIIDSIRVNTQAFERPGLNSLFGNDLYNESLRILTLPEVLNTYGLPSDIALNVDVNMSEPGAGDAFNIWLIYQDQSAILRFYGNADVSDTAISFCPTESFADFTLLSPGGQNRFQEILTGLMEKWGGATPTFPQYRALEEAIGISDREFVQTFSSASAGCLQTPTTLWVP